MSEDFLSTEVLVVGILDIGPYDTFITQIKYIAQVMQSHHQADGFIGVTGSRRIGFAEIFFDTLPIDTLSQLHQRMIGIDNLKKHLMALEEIDFLLFLDHFLLPNCKVFTL